ncbi:hypothetical protein C0995_013795, partial [Termitomyces sp. Mi166
MSNAQKSSSRLAKTIHNFIDRLTPGSRAPSPIPSQGSNVYDAGLQITEAIATSTSNASLISATANPSREERPNKVWIRFQYYNDLPDKLGCDGKSRGKKWQRSVWHNCNHKNMIDTASIPLLYSNASEEFETSRGGSSSYSQPTTSSRLQQDSYGMQVAGGGSEYVLYVPREHHPSSS